MQQIQWKQWILKFKRPTLNMFILILIISLFLITINLFVYCKIANAPMRFSYTQQQKFSSTTIVGLRRTNNESNCILLLHPGQAIFKVYRGQICTNRWRYNHDLIIIYQYHEADGIHQMGWRTLSPGFNPIVHHLYSLHRWHSVHEHQPDIIRALSGALNAEWSKILLHEMMRSILLSDVSSDTTKSVFLFGCVGNLCGLSKNLDVYSSNI